MRAERATEMPVELPQMEEENTVRLVPAAEVEDAPTAVVLTEGPMGGQDQDEVPAIESTFQRVEPAVQRDRTRQVSTTVLWICRYGISEGRMPHREMWLPWSTLNRHRRMRHITLAEVREIITSPANWNFRNQEPYILTRWLNGEEW